MVRLNELFRSKKKKQEIKWTKEAEDAFIKIENALVFAPILVSPDFSKQFSIQCDANEVAVGGILTQEIDGVERIIAFASIKGRKNLCNNQNGVD